MSIQRARTLGEEVAKQYNPEGNVPFPFEKILDDKSNLRVIHVPNLPENISGATGYSEQLDKFTIIINSAKPEKRQYFTLAHELGHYFLHAEQIRSAPGKIYIDSDGYLDTNGMLLREDEGPTSDMEREANNFAGALLMPETAVKEAWAKLNDVKGCAEVFGVSLVAMSVRLQKLGITDAE